MPRLPARSISGLALACTALAVLTSSIFSPTQDVRAAPVASAAPALLLAVPTPMSPLVAARSYAVQLERRDSSGTLQPVYHRFTVQPGIGAIAVSPDGRLLAYDDPSSVVHLVTLAGGQDRVLGQGGSPAFSFDSRYVAYGPSVAGEGRGVDHLSVAATSATTASTLAAGPHLTIAAFAWAPHDDRLAMESADTDGNTVFGIAAAGKSETQQIVSRTYTLDGGLAWAVDGRALLYWHYAGSKRMKNIISSQFGLLRLMLPAGPTSTLLAPTLTAWSEGLPPAAVVDSSGTHIASLLGAPGAGFNQVVVFAGPGVHPLSVALPGEPRAVAFTPSGSQGVAVWQSLRGAVTVSRAVLFSSSSGQAQDLGPAVAAFWVP